MSTPHNKPLSEDAAWFWRTVNQWFRERGRGFVLEVEGGGPMSYVTPKEIEGMPVDAQTRHNLAREVDHYNPEREAVIFLVDALGYGEIDVVYRHDKPLDMTI